MKVRNSLVSNSSSASFLIMKRDLTEEQIEYIKDHQKVGKALGIDNAETDPWTIRENQWALTGYTYMDNFSMYKFFHKIDADTHDADWGDDPFLPEDF